MARKLWINNQLANINNFTKGYIIFEGVTYEWDNAPEEIIQKVFMTSDNEIFVTSDNKVIIINTKSKSKVSKGTLSIDHNGKVSYKLLNLLRGSVEDDTLIL